MEGLYLAEGATCSHCRTATPTLYTPIGSDEGLCPICAEVHGLWLLLRSEPPPYRSRGHIFACLCAARRLLVDRLWPLRCREGVFIRLVGSVRELLRF